MNEINLQALAFRNDIAQLISSSPLPACIVYYIIKDIYNTIENQYQSILLSEKQQCLNSQQQQELLNDEKE